MSETRIEVDGCNLESRSGMLRTDNRLRQLLRHGEAPGGHGGRSDRRAIAYRVIPACLPCLTGRQAARQAEAGIQKA